MPIDTMLALTQVLHSTTDQAFFVHAYRHYARSDTSPAPQLLKLALCMHYGRSDASPVLDNCISLFKFMHTHRRHERSNAIPVLDNYISFLHAYS